MATRREKLDDAAGRHQVPRGLGMAEGFEGRVEADLHSLRYWKSGNPLLGQRQVNSGQVIRIS